MEIRNSAAPIVKSLSRLVSQEELRMVSGAGTIVQTSDAAVGEGLSETTYNSKGKYTGMDTVEKA